MSTNFLVYTGVEVMNRILREDLQCSPEDTQRRRCLLQSTLKEFGQKVLQIEAEEEDLIQTLKNTLSVSQKKITNDDKKDLARCKEG